MTQYPYLDLSVLGELRSLLVSPRAAIVLTRNLDDVLWANGEGTLLLGKTRFGDALEAGLNAGTIMARQIAATASQLRSDKSVNGSMRIRGGSKLLPFTLKTLLLPNREEAVLLITDPLHGLSWSQGEMAQIAVAALDGRGHYSAIIGSDGSVTASTDGFGSLELSGENLNILVDEVRLENDRLVKRPIVVGDVQMAAGIARIDADTHLLILARAPEEAATVEATSSAKSADEAGMDGASAKTVDAPARIISSRRPELIKGDGGSDIQRWYYRQRDRTQSGSQNNAEQSEPSVQAGTFEQNPDLPGNHFQFQPASRAVRFAWRLDENGTFVFASPELAETVGPLAGDIVGKSWGEIDAQLNLDQDETISALLEKQDTWSGQTVLWPIQGTNLQVPVDLAGLPSFSKDKSFSGFHGFGRINSHEAVIDPLEAGLALAIAQRGRPEPDKAAAKDRSEAVGELPGSTNDNNIVDLKLQRLARQNTGLTVEEQANFTRIGDKLSDEVAGKGQLDNNQAASPEKPPLDQKNQQAELRDYIPSAFAANRQSPRIDTSILERLPIPVIIFRDNKVLFTNQDFNSLSGYESRDDLARRGGIETLLGSPDGNRDGYTRIVHRDGSLISVTANLQSVPWDKGRALLLAMREEIADQTAETDVGADDKEGSNIIALAPSQVELPIAGFGDISSHELSGILDTATDGVVVLGRDGKIRSINRAAEALFGQDAADVAGKNFSVLFARESHRAVQDYIVGLSENGVASLLNDGRELIGKEAQGGLIPLFVTIGRLEESDGFCAVLRDITEWKMAEEDLVAAKRQAELANDQKTGFLAKVSHEIRTPLNAIIGFSEIMLEERFGKISIDRYREYLRDINRSGSHVLELVNDLLDISKIEAGKLELDFDEVRLNDIIAEGVALTQPQANRDHIIIRTSLSGAVPTIVADARSIRQIILNLVSNAIKYTREGGQVIVSTVYEETGEVVLRVRDTGIGMSESEIATALMPFRQIQTVSSRRGEGTGLGLPLTKALVEANRAQFSIESTPGEGTLVEVFFPPTRVLTE